MVDPLARKMVPVGGLFIKSQVILALFLGGLALADRSPSRTRTCGEFLALTPGAESPLLAAIRKNGGALKEPLAAGMSQEDRFRLLNQVAARHPLWAVAQIERYGITSAEQRFAFVEVAFRAVPEAVLARLATFKLSTERNLFFARRALDLDRDKYPAIAYHLMERLGDGTVVFPEDEHARVARYVAGVQHGRFVRGAHHFKLTPALRFELAKVDAPINGADVTAENWDLFTTEQWNTLFDLSPNHPMYYAFSHYTELVEKGRRPPIFSRARAIHLLTRLAATEDHSQNLFYDRLGLTGDEVFPILMLQARFFPASALSAIGMAEGRRLASHLSEKYFQFTEAQRKALYRACWKSNPLLMIKMHTWPEEISETTPVEVVRRALEGHIARGNENHAGIRAEWVPMLWDRSPRRDVGLGILREAIRLDDAGEAVPATSREVLARASGFSLAALQGLNVSPHVESRLYEVTLEFIRGAQSPVFAATVIDGEVWRQKDLRDLVSMLAKVSLAHQVSGGDPEAWTRVWRELGRPAHLDLASTQELAKGAEAILLREVRARFGQDLTITADQYLELEKKWGSLEPIFTLLSRFQGVPTWRQGVKPLARIFEMAAKGLFTRYKFHGFPGDEMDRLNATWQIQPIIDAGKLEEWMKQRTRAALAPDEDREATVRARLAAIRTQIRTGLIGHLDLTGIVGSTEVRAVVQKILSSKESPRKLVAELQQLVPDRRVLLRTVVDGLAAAEDTSEIRRLTCFLQESESVFRWDSVDARGDLKSILGQLENLPAAKDTIVVTTTFHDARTMTVVGDLVDTNSCQNYKSGGVPFTLPGYIIDAHTQGMVSFALTAAQFTRAEDFRKVVGWLRGGKSVTTVYDGDPGIVTFGLDGTAAKVSTIPLRKGYSRRIIRAGKNAANGIGIMDEPDYSHVHPALVLMQAQMDSILVEMARALGATLREAIEVAASRNPMGTYSDLGGGVVGTIGPFRIVPQTVGP